MTVAVLGGGPAGLYAALLLARRGIAVTVFEREAFVGGLAAGRVVDGQRVDHGSHRLHPSTDPDILADLQVMLGSSLQERSRRGRIHLEGRWLSFPLSMREVVTTLPAPMLGRLGWGAATALVRSAGPEPTFADVVTAGLGRPMGDMFYFPYARKIWGVEPEHLSGEQARRRIAADSPGKLLRKALSGSSGRSFFYPAAGFGAIPEAIATTAAAAGTELRLGEAVQGLEPRGEGWDVVTSSGPEPVRLVLSTLPLSVLVRMLPAPPDAVRAAGELRSRAMVLVYLTVEVPQWTPFDAHYFPSTSVPFTRISEPKNYRTSAADPPARTVLCVEIPCDVADRTWKAPDHDLARRVRGAVSDLDLPDPGERAHVVRLPHAYPVYRTGVEAALGTAHDWIDSLAGLVTFGRQGLFAHDNTHHALVMARDAVACISPSLEFDAHGWARARERFAQHVVED